MNIIIDDIMGVEWVEGGDAARLIYNNIKEAAETLHFRGDIVVFCEQRPDDAHYGDNNNGFTDPWRVKWFYRPDVHSECGVW